MAFANSSVIGVDFNNSSTTALFGLTSSVKGTQDSEWTYCIATGTLTTGQIVAIFNQGTAYGFTTALLNGGDVLGTTGNLDLGVIQCNAAQGSFAWVARRGMNLYVASTGTIPVGAAVGFMPANGNFNGAIGTSLLVAVGQTAAGIFVTTSSSTATAAVCQATLHWPRPLVGVPQA